MPAKRHLTFGDFDANDVAKQWPVWQDWDKFSLFDKYFILKLITALIGNLKNSKQF
jgi:hypothetical protein